MISRTCSLLFALALSATAADGPDSTARRATMIAGFEQEVAAATTALAKTPDSIPLLSRRGDSHLFLAHFCAAVADFEKMIALDPAQDAPHWRLGIAYYFTGEFGKSARQFEKYHAHDGHDRENGIWKFLADARALGLEKARTQMLTYDRFDREPFPALYEMFAGQKTSADLLAHLAQKELAADPAVQFFGHYYLGLHESLLGHRDTERQHLRRAIANFPDPRSAGGPGYMWQVARLHLDALAAEKP